MVIPEEQGFLPDRRKRQMIARRLILQLTNCDIVKVKEPSEAEGGVDNSNGVNPHRTSVDGSV